MALKCADLGHVGEGLEVHLAWVGRLEEEFYRQVGVGRTLTRV